MKIGRNEPCPCGSGKKYKKCCLNKPAQTGTLVYTELDQLSNSVLTYIKTKNWKEAEAVCKKLLTQYPDQVDGLHRLAAMWEARGNNSRAADFYRKAADFAKKAMGFDQKTIDFFMEKAEQLEE